MYNSAFQGSLSLENYDSQDEHTCAHTPTPCVCNSSVAVSTPSSFLALSSIHSPCIIHTHNCTVSHDSVNYSYHSPGAVMFWGMLVQWPPSPVSTISITISDKARAIEGGGCRGVWAGVEGNIASFWWLSTLLFSWLISKSTLWPKPPPSRPSWNVADFFGVLILFAKPFLFTPVVCVPARLASTGRRVNNRSSSSFS